MNDPLSAGAGALVTALAASLAKGLTIGGSGYRHDWLFRPLLRLLASGAPVPVGVIAQATGRSGDTVRAALADWPDTEYDDAGRVVGHGITLNPTPHRFIVRDVELYTWCALDTLMFPHLLDRSARVESPCHASSAPIRMTVHPTDGVADLTPATAVVSLVTPEQSAPVRTGFCTQVHFYAERSLADEWRAERPGATVLPVGDAYRIGYELDFALRSDATGPDSGRAPR